MFILKGPYPALQTVVLLPSPAMGNNEALTCSVQVLRGMDGTTYSYVKSKRGRKKYSWDFSITKEKTEELEDFVVRYHGSVIQTEDHAGDIRNGWLTINPIQFQGKSADFYNVTLTFEEKV